MTFNNIFLILYFKKVLCSPAFGMENQANPTATDLIAIKLLNQLHEGVTSYLSNNVERIISFRNHHSR